MNNLQAYKVKYTAWKDPAIRDLIRVLGEVETKITYIEDNGGSTGGGPNPDLSIAGWIFEEVPVGVKDGVNTTFTTANNFNPITVALRLNGVQQRKTVDYNISGNNQVIFVVPPESTDVIDMDYRILSGESLDDYSFEEVPAGLINGVNTTFTTAVPFIEETLVVRLNGVPQRKSVDYIITQNNTFLMTVASFGEDFIDVDYIKL